MKPEHTIPFELVSFDKVLLRGNAKSVTVPTTDGEITILPHHISLVSIIAVGEARVTLIDKYGKEVHEYITVGGGFIEVSSKGVSLLVRTAEAVSEIDEERAREALEKARTRLAELAKSKRKDNEYEYSETNALLARNLMRLKTLKRRKKH